MTKTDSAGASKLRGWQTSAVFSCFFEVGSSRRGAGFGGGESAMSVYLFFDRLQNGEKRLERYIYNDGSITVGDWVEKMCALYAGEEWFPAGLTRDTCTLTCQNGANINLKLGVSTLESSNGNPLTVAVREKGATCPQPSGILRPPGIPHPRPVGLRMCGECKIEKVMKKDFGRRQW